MARLSALTPLKFRDATYVGPTLTYFVSSKISKVTKSGTSNAGFNYLTAGIGFPGSFDDWIVNESVATVLADSADGGTPLQYAFTVLSIDGVVPDSNIQTQNLNIDNILYMSDDTNGNANIVYKDNSNMSPVIYVVSGSSASLAALINGTASDVTGGGNNAFTGNNTHAGTETFAKGTISTLPNTYSNQTGITAHAGGGLQTTGASLITKEMTNFTVVASSGDSGTFAAAAVVGNKYSITNSGAFPLSVFPFTGGTIDGQTAGYEVVIPVGQQSVFECFVAGAWISDIVNQGFQNNYSIQEIGRASCR